MLINFFSTTKIHRKKWMNVLPPPSNSWPPRFFSSNGPNRPQPTIHASMEHVECKEEISYLQKLRHPRLVSFLGFARDAGQVADSKPRRISQGWMMFFVFLADYWVVLHLVYTSSRCILENFEWYPISKILSIFLNPNIGSLLVFTNFQIGRFECIFVSCWAGQVLIVMEFMSGGSLSQILFTKKTFLSFRSLRQKNQITSGWISTKKTRVGMSWYVLVKVISLGVFPGSLNFGWLRHFKYT